MHLDDLHAAGAHLLLEVEVVALGGLDPDHVVEQQLAKSTHVDDESRKRAIESVHEIDEAAHQRGLGERAAEEMGRHPPGEQK